jgi:hypothetical protein
MARTNTLYTGWQHKPHLITMPSATLSLADRIARMPLPTTGRVLKDEIALSSGRSEDAAKTLEAQILQICPGYIMSVTGIERETPTMFRRRNASVAHLLAFAAAHLEELRKYARVYAFGGTVNADDADETALVPFLSVVTYPGVDKLSLGQYAVDPEARVFRGTRREAFLLVEDMGNCADLACKGCTEG